MFTCPRTRTRCPASEFKCHQTPCTVIMPPPRSRYNCSLARVLAHTGGRANYFCPLTGCTTAAADAGTGANNELRAWPPGCVLILSGTDVMISTYGRNGEHECNTIDTKPRQRVVSTIEWSAWRSVCARSQRGHVNHVWRRQVVDNLGPRTGRDE